MINEWSPQVRWRQCPISSRTEDAESVYHSPRFLMMNLFFSAEVLLRSEKVRHLNRKELISLDMKISNPIFLSLVVQSLSPVWLFATLWTVACQAPLSSTISQSLLKFMSIKSVMPSSHLILCCPPLFLLSIFPSIRAFAMSQLSASSDESIGASSSSNEHSGFISFRID